MPYYFNNIMFPYPNMQQLNLDWIMQRVGETPTVINLPATSSARSPTVITLPAISSAADVLGIIDDNIDDIPIGFSLLALGNPAIDTASKCAMLIMIKQDSTHFNYFGTCTGAGTIRGIRNGLATGQDYAPGPFPFVPPTP